MSDMLIPKGTKRKRNKPKRLECPEHIDYVKSLPCCCCNAPAVHAHHLLRGPVRGMGRRAGDDHTIPMCHHHHSKLHNDGLKSVNEIEFLSRYCVDGMALAAQLWAECGGKKTSPKGES